MNRSLEDILANLDHVGCDNQTAIELCDEIEQLRVALSDSLRMLEAVRYTTGLGKKQMERIAKHRALLSSPQDGEANG